jgi:hypothetical protein
MSPEVLLLAPADPTDLYYQKLIDLLVEYGIHFASGPDEALPAQVPADLTGICAIVADEALPEAWRTPPPGFTGTHVAYRRPEHFHWHEERGLWRYLNQLLLAGIRPDHPAALAQRGARDDVALLRGQLDACRRHEPEWLRKWCDSSLVRLEAMWQAARHFGWDDVRREVLECVDTIVVTYADAPVYGRGTNAAGLFKHPIFPGLLLPLWQETGEVRYRDAALATMEPLAEAQAIAAEWQHGQPLLQCESLDRKPWQWAMRARWCGEPAFYAPAVACVKAGHEVLFDPARSLWCHYGVRGRQRGLAWGRGQGWALYGVLGLLEHLPPEHPDFGLIAGYLAATAEGLRRTQDPVTGLWHNVVDEPGTRRDVSGTTHAVRHLSRAWRLGLCRAPWLPAMLGRAWWGLKAHTFQHRTCSRCYGSGPGYDLPFYATMAAGGNYKGLFQAGAEYLTAFG